MLKIKSPVVAVVGAATAIVLLAGGGAVAGSMVGSPQIHDNSIRSKDIRDGAVSGKDIRNGVEAAIRRRATKTYVDRQVDSVQAGKDGQDGVANPEVDGTYKDLLEQPGVQTFTVDCAEGKVALGGGFSIDFPQHRENVRFVGSTPANFTEIPGDPEGSVIAHGWEVQVINDGPQTSLRPWVSCASVN